MATQFISIGRQLDYEAYWAEDIAQANILLAQNFSGPNFATRGAMMAYLENLDVVDPLPQNGVAYPYTGWGSGDPGKYLDPVPVGTEEKLGLDFTDYLTGSASYYAHLRLSEGATEGGPMIEFPIASPPPLEYYWRIIFKIDAAPLAADYGGSHRKIGFLNHFGPGNGQIVPVLYSAERPFPSAYRIDGSGSKIFQLNHGSQPLGRQRQLYGAYETGAAAPSTANQWDQRWGPSVENYDPTDTDFALVNRLLANDWYQQMYYVNLNYLHPTLGITRGMIKSWGSRVGLPPQLQMLHFRDCRFLTSAAPQSVRFGFRPENSILNVEGGLRFDNVLVRSGSTAPKFWGGFSVPYEGTEIPPGHPISGTHDGVGD